MKNPRKSTSEIGPPIRLSKQTTFPTAREIIEMAHEGKRSNKRIELPWQPEGRPDPVILAFKFDEYTEQSNWLLYSNHKSDAPVVWSGVDPDPTKVILALRDWLTTAKETEGWAKPESAGPSNGPLGPNGVPVPSPNPAYNVPGAPTPAHAYPAMPFQQPTFTLPPLPLQQPYPQQTQPSGAPAYPYSYPQPAPQHWAVGPPGPSGPLPPELWTVQPAPVPSSLGSAGGGVPLLGDLLVAAGVIPTPSLQAALTLQNASQMERKKIGEILMTTGAMPTSVLKAAVDLQDLARRGIIPSSRVTDVLRQVHATGSSIEQVLGFDKTPVKQPEPVRATTAGTVHKRPSDELIERESKVSDEERGKFKHVLQLLKQANLTGDEGTEKAKKLLDLFKKASILKEDDIVEASKSASNSADTVKALLVKEAIDPLTFEAGLACQRLVSDTRLKPEQAIIALGYCQRMRVSLKDAICDMNWLIPTDDL